MLDFIVNPKAGMIKGLKYRRTVKKIKKYLEREGIEYCFHETNHKNHAKEYATELINNGATDIIVVGGDGTLHEVINGFHSFDKCNLGLIPCGTGNDFAGVCGIPKNTNKALDIIVKGAPKYTDYMQMPSIRGMNVIGMGIDVDVLEKYENLKRKTNFGYTRCLVKSLIKFNYVDFDATINGETTHYESFIACAANGTRFGGGIKICPDASIDDGKIDFVAVEKMKKIKIPMAFIRLKLGKVKNISGAHMIKAERIKVSGGENSIIQVDGELYKNIEFDVKVVHNELKMYRK